MRTVFDTLKRTRSALVALGVSVCVFALAVWLPNMRLLLILWTDTSTSIADKIVLPMKLLPSILTNFTPLSATYTIAIVILAGINAALVTDLIRERRMHVGGAAAGGVGMIAGALGVGCAACGSLILTTLVGTTLGTGTLALLPLGGGEFGILGVGLLGYATYLLAKQINKTTCEITV